MSIVNKSRYIHECDVAKTNIIEFKKSILDYDIELEAKMSIIDFYLFNTPSESKESPNALKLSYYGWGVNKGGKSLEGRLLKSSSLQQFVVIKSKTIRNTLIGMDLSNSYICISHERAVFSISGKTSIDENGKFKFEPNESRMACLFRHIRNAIAHNQTYCFDNGMILFVDYDGKNVTAKILVNCKTLLNWIDIVKGGQK